MKRWLALLLAIVVLTATGCSFKVERDTFYLPQDQVTAVELQMEYKSETGNYYCSKKVTDTEGLELVCEKIRKLPVRRASSAEPHPMTVFPMIIVISGEKEHHLVLTEEMAFYDQIAYEYTDKSTFKEFITLYNGLEQAEEKAVPNLF
jgi:hypothetical protein